MWTKKPQGTEDNNHVRCKRCGFINDLSKNKQGDGSGISLIATTIAGVSLYNPTVTSGCSFCGCKNFMNWKR